MKNIVLVLLSVIIMLLIVEGVLRLYGFKPGVYQQSPWFTEVDSLYIKQGFIADSLGIFRVSKPASDEVRRRITALNAGETIASVGKYEVEEVYGNVYQMHETNAGKVSNNFIAYATALRGKTNKTDLDSAIIDYAFNCPYNEDGFRSIAFKPYSGNKKKILLIGDSFTWGHSARPLSNSFADELLSKGYVVYNAGVSGADPAQYLAVAQKFIPLLKPDYVITNFYIGNDVLFVRDNHAIKYFDRPVISYQPYHYNTNAGNIIACPQGDYLSTADSAYDFIYNYYSIPNDNWFNMACSLTAIGTLGWKCLNAFDLVSANSKKYDWYWQSVGAKFKDMPYCNKQIASIDSITQSIGAKHLLIVIENTNSMLHRTADKFPHLFEGMKYYPSPVEKAHYREEDGHYDNEGHKQHADFIEGLLKQSQ